MVDADKAVEGRDVNESLVTESERQYPSVGDGDEYAAVRHGLTQITFGSCWCWKASSVASRSQLSKRRAWNLADSESGRVELDRSDVLRRESPISGKAVGGSNRVQQSRSITV